LQKCWLISGDLKILRTPAVLAILVLEDLAMAVYLPLVAVLLAGGGPSKIALSVSLAIAAVFLVLVVAVRYGQPLSRIVAHESDEIVLLTTFGAVLLVLVFHSGSKCRPPLGHFSLASPCRAQWPNKHIGSSPPS